MLGRERRWQLDRDRKQLTGAATYFLDTCKPAPTPSRPASRSSARRAGKASQQRWGGNIETIYANGVPS